MEEDTEQLLQLRRKFSLLLKDLSYMCKGIIKKSDSLLKQLEMPDNHVTSSNIETIGLKMSSLLQMSKENSQTCIQSLITDLESINVSRSDRILPEMYSKLLHTKSSSEVGTMTEIETNSLPDAKVNTSTENSFESYSDSEDVRGNGLSLRRQTTADTIQTEDSWRDTLQRSKDIPFTSSKLKSEELKNGTSKTDEELSPAHSRQNIKRLTVDKTPNTNPKHVVSSDDEIYAAKTQKIKKIKRRRVSSSSKKSTGSVKTNKTKTSELLDKDFTKNIMNAEFDVEETDKKSCNKNSERKSKIQPEKESQSETNSQNMQSNDERIIEDDEMNSTESSKTVINNQSQTSQSEVIEESSLLQKYFNSLEKVSGTTEHMYDTIVDVLQECTVEDSLINSSDKNASLLKVDKHNSSIEENLIDHSDAYSVETEKLPSENEDLNENEAHLADTQQLENGHSYSEEAVMKSKEQESTTDNDSDKIEVPSSEEKSYNIDNESDDELNILNDKPDTAKSNEGSQIIQERNYSSSFIDSDETDIENVPNKSDTVQLNMDNFSLELSSGNKDGQLSQVGSVKSYEFDLNNYENYSDITNDNNSKDFENIAEELENILSNNVDDQPGTNSKKIIEKSDDKQEANKDELEKGDDNQETNKDQLEKGDESKKNEEAISAEENNEQKSDDKQDENNDEPEKIDDTSKTAEVPTPEENNNVDKKDDATMAHITTEDIEMTDEHDKLVSPVQVPTPEEIDTNKFISVRTPEEINTMDKKDDETTSHVTTEDIEMIDERDKLASPVQDNENEDDAENLMDVTLEEIIFDDKGENQTPNSSQDTIPYYDLKPEMNHIKTEEVDFEDLEYKVKMEKDLEDFKPTSDIGDELLELLKEVPISPFKNYEMSKENEKDDDIDESAEAQRILQLLKEDDSELSDSVESVSIGDLSDTSVVSFKDDDNMQDKDDNEVIDKQIETNEVPKKEHKMLECYVRLERMNFSEEQIAKHRKSSSDNIDWLCDMNNLMNKRKHTSSPPFDKQRRKKSKKYVSSSSSSSSSLSSSESSDESNLERPDSRNLNKEQEQRLDDILAKAICHQLKNGSDNGSDDSTDSDDSTQKKKKNRKTRGSDGNEETEKAQLTKEELEKRAWRNDPLLRGTLPTESDSDRSDSSVKKKRKTQRYEYDSEYSIQTDQSDSDSDAEDKGGVKVKNLLSVSDSSDSNDSDVQYISPIKNRNPESEENSMSSTQKGRRNIRSLVNENELAEETQRANKEELERIERLKDRQKVFETHSQSLGSQQLSDTEDDNALVLDIDEETGKTLVEVHPVITKKLKPHQRNGIKFMWDSCYESLARIKTHPGSGCILAHCMGLGKTFQVLALIHTLFSHDETNTKHVLIVCPLSTVNNWKKELKFAFKGLPNDQKYTLYTFSGTKHLSEKYGVVKHWHVRKKSILVVGYEGFETVTNVNKLEKAKSQNLSKMILEALVDPGPDLVVCDEGHLIKNKNAVRAMALNKIKTKRRIVLTGTPLQNNLVEYYHMVHFVKPNLLGTLNEYKTNFVNPITNGQYEDSTNSDIKLMRSRTHVLHKIVAETVQRVEDSELEIYLPRMLDHAVFIQLHQLQVDLYNDFLNRPTADNTKVGKRFLSDFHILQYLCTHPYLLNLMGKPKNKKEQDVICEDDEPPVNLENWWKDKMPEDALDKIEYGHKMMVLRAVIEECETIGDKLLVFSQKLAELDLIEHFLKTVGTTKCPSWLKKRDYHRMDGDTSPELRSDICDKFNDTSNKKFRLLLMSTKVGGLGLNLTAANRVVIMTVNWNPSYDTQSVYRAYRFGQKKQVYVYRLISLDTMEEKVYQRSVTKLAIARRVVDKHQISRHYKSVDLQELYSCRPTADNERPTPNVPEDEMLAKLILKLPCIFKYHEHKALLVNRTEDTLTEQEMAAAWEDFKNKDKPKAVPLPPPLPMHINQIPNGPTFEQAYNLGAYSLNQGLAQHYANLEAQLQQYYQPNDALLSSLFAKAPRRPISNITETIDLDDHQPSTSTNRGPLFSSSASTAKSTNQMWSYMQQQDHNQRLLPPSVTSASKLVSTVQNRTVTNLSSGILSSASPSLTPDSITIPDDDAPKTSNSNSETNTIKSPALDYIFSKGFLNNKPAKKGLVENPFSVNQMSKVSQRPIKRRFGSQEFIIKKSNTDGANLLQRILNNLPNADKENTVEKPAVNIVDSINLADEANPLDQLLTKELESRGIIVTESKNDHTNNVGVAPIL